jgi:hypothetical protein
MPRAGFGKEFRKHERRPQTAEEKFTNEIQRKCSFGILQATIVSICLLQNASRLSGASSHRAARARLRAVFVDVDP